MLDTVMQLSNLYTEARLNQMVYDHGLIQKNTYESVCHELLVQIDKLEKICYNGGKRKAKAGHSYGLIANQERV